MIRKLIWLQWEDATFLGHTWKTADELNGEGFKMETAGFLVKEDKAGYYVAADKDPDEKGRYRSVSFVPRVNVKKKKVVRVEVKWPK